MRCADVAVAAAADDGICTAWLAQLSAVLTALVQLVSQVSNTGNKQVVTLMYHQ